MKYFALCLCVAFATVTTVTATIKAETAAQPVKKIERVKRAVLGDSLFTRVGKVAKETGEEVHDVLSGLAGRTPLIGGAVEGAEEVVKSPAGQIRRAKRQFLGGLYPYSSPYQIDDYDSVEDVHLHAPYTYYRTGRMYPHYGHHDDIYYY